MENRKCNCGNKKANSITYLYFYFQVRASPAPLNIPATFFVIVPETTTRVPQRVGYCRGGNRNVVEWGIPCIENKNKMQMFKFLH